MLGLKPCGIPEKVLGVPVAVVCLSSLFWADGAVLEEGGNCAAPGVKKEGSPFVLAAGLLATPLELF
jgi:hypothetical protein